MREAVLAHDGEALKARQAFQHATQYEQDSVIEFLKTLQVLPEGARSPALHRTAANGTIDEAKAQPR